MNIRTVFINDEPRLRAGWRLLLQTMLLFLFSIGIGLPLILLITISPALADNLFVNQIVSFIVITGSVFIARRFLDRRSISSLGLKINRRAFADLKIRSSRSYLKPWRPCSFLSSLAGTKSCSAAATICKLWKAA